MGRALTLRIFRRPVVDSSPDNQTKLQKASGRRDGNQVWGYLGTGHARRGLGAILGQRPDAQQQHDGHDERHSGDGSRFGRSPQINSGKFVLFRATGSGERTCKSEMGKGRSILGAASQGARSGICRNRWLAGDFGGLGRRRDVTSPLPYPFVVDGDVTGGKGTVFYRGDVAVGSVVVELRRRSRSARNTGYDFRWSSLSAYSAKDLALGVRSQILREHAQDDRCWLPDGGALHGGGD